MTNKELIDKLKQFDGNLEIELFVDCYVWSIKEVGTEKNRDGNEVITIYS